MDPGVLAELEAAGLIVRSGSSVLKDTAYDGAAVGADARRGHTGLGVCRCLVTR